MVSEDKKSKKFDVYHYQGPIVFFAIAIIVTIQLVQLLHYDIEQIYNMRVSLNSIFSIEAPSEDQISTSATSSKKSALYLESVTSKIQFELWLSAVVNNTFKPANSRSQLLFANKTITLGDVVLIKYDVKDVTCATRVPGNKSCIAASYTDDSKSRILSLQSLATRKILPAICTPGVSSKQTLTWVFSPQSKETAGAITLVDTNTVLEMTAALKKRY